MIRVVVADDQPLVRSGIAMILSGEPDIEVAGEAGNGEEAISQAARIQPDIVLMDVRMPGMDGVTATRSIASDQFSRNPDAPVKVLILTTYNVQDSVYQALRAGASGFMLKDAAPAELVRAVRAVVAGNGWLDPAVTAELISEFAARHDPLRPTPAEMSELTSREREVLVLVAQGLSNTEIAEDLVISEATVKTHFGRILMKLRLRDRAQAVVVAYQTGLIEPGSTSFRPRPPRLAEFTLPAVHTTEVVRGRSVSARTRRMPRATHDEHVPSTRKKVNSCSRRRPSRILQGPGKQSPGKQTPGKQCGHFPGFSSIR